MTDHLKRNTSSFKITVIVYTIIGACFTLLWRPSLYNILVWLARPLSKHYLCTSDNIVFFFFSQAATDMAKKNKSLQAQLKEITGLYEEEQRSRDEQHELLTRAEKKSSDLSLELEELKASVEQVRTYTCTTRLLLCKVLLHRSKEDVL